MSWEATAAIALAIVSLGTAVVSLVAQRGKQKADAADTITGAATKLAANLSSRVEQQQERIMALEAEAHDANRRIDELVRMTEAAQREIADLRAGVRLLCRQIRDMGGRPVWVPEVQAVHAEDAG